MANAQGEQGIQGKTGVQGKTGKQGEKGDKGETGNAFVDWFTSHEPIVTIVIFIVLAVMSFSTAVLARQTQDAIKKSDLIVQCTTPGTKCYNLSQAAAQQRLKEIKAAAFCIMDTITITPLQDFQKDRAVLLTNYNTCVANASK